jgi:hypothetical protein
MGQNYEFSAHLQAMIGYTRSTGYERNGMNYFYGSITPQNDIDYIDIANMELRISRDSTHG